MAKYVQEMMDTIFNLQNKIDEYQETCLHINKVCEGDYQDSKEIEDDIFADPFADRSFDVKESGTIIECHCPECLKKWVEIVK